MKSAWLLKRAAYLAVLALAAASLVGLLALGWSGVAAILNGGWPAWVNNLASISQIALALVALVSWCVAKIRRTGIAKPGDGAAAWLLALLSLLLPGRDRERFVGEVMANLAYSRRRWERTKELLSVARAVPGIAATQWRARGGYAADESRAAPPGTETETADPIKLGDVWDALEQAGFRITAAAAGTKLLEGPHGRMIMLDGRELLGWARASDALLEQTGSWGIKPIASGKYPTGPDVDPKYDLPYSGVPLPADRSH